MFGTQVFILKQQVKLFGTPHGSHF
jgi:hypothetical protein